MDALDASFTSKIKWGEKYRLYKLRALSFPMSSMKMLEGKYTKEDSRRGFGVDK